jgi:hypothetical protein
MANRKVEKDNKVYFKETSYEQEKHITAINEEHFNFICATCVPDLYLLWEHIKIYKINPYVLRSVVEAIGEVSHSMHKGGKFYVDIKPDAKTGEPTLVLVRGIHSQEPQIGVLISST